MDTTSQRPIIAGFHPDPTICMVDGIYYLSTSSFEYAPSCPIYKSLDLRHWELISHALADFAHVDLRQADDSMGTFASTLRAHAGRLWLVTTNVSDGGGQLLVSAETATGPWSTPVRIPEIDGIDPDLAWDDDGTCYLTYAGRNGIMQVTIDPESGRVLSEPIRLWSGTGGKFPEGPHLFQRTGLWYLLIAEGGTERGHSVSVARGPSPFGPFEGHEANPILTRRGTGNSVQSTGHADLVHDGEDNWAIVYLGVRPRGSSPEWHVLGRETFASTVTWKDGWPVVGDVIEPHEVNLLVEENLPPEVLSLEWVSPRDFPTDVVAWDVADAQWVLRPDGERGAFLGHRQEALYATIRAELGGDGVGGVAVRIDPRHEVVLELSRGQVRAISRIGGISTELAVASLPAGGSLEIRTVPSSGPMFSTTIGPDILTLGISDEMGFQPLATVDGRYVSTEVAGGMTGRMMGIYAESGRIAILRCVYTGCDDWAVLRKHLDSIGPSLPMLVATNNATGSTQSTRE